MQQNLMKMAWFPVIFLAGFALAQETATITTNTTVATAPASTNTTGSSFSLALGGTNNGPMVITSDLMEVDYKEYVAAFDNNVHVTDPQFEMTCDRMLVFFEGTNHIKRIIAINHVVMTQPDRNATCDKAVYEHASGKITMTGSPVVNHGNDHWTGTELTVWLSDQRVTGKDARLTISSESMKKGNVKP
jgi:lipopolysaccharide transport protein LptA